MAQFDVYANPSKTQHGEIPWMADIQSEILDEVPTRLVMRSALRANMPAAMPQSLCPTIG
ncbi:CcdB family protein [Variovorax sp. tm]|uniref:CcdB family protein n=1 Tax=Variovorax atrisoli TaxID=3394203 RepID=UPI0010E4358F